MCRACQGRVIGSGEVPRARRGWRVSVCRGCFQSFQPGQSAGDGGAAVAGRAGAGSGRGDLLDLDPHTGVRPGQCWEQALQQANTRCEAVICLLSAQGAASHEYTTQYRYAETLNKAIVCASAGSSRNARRSRGDRGAATLRSSRGDGGHARGGRNQWSRLSRRSPVAADRSLSRACVRMTKLPLGGPETPRRRRVRLAVLGTDLGTKRGATAEMG